MLAYLVRRFLGMVFVVFSILTITFFIAALSPGDPAVAIAGPKSSAETRQLIRHNLGLDRPLLFNFRASWATATAAAVLLYPERDLQGPPLLLALQGDVLAITDRYTAGAQDCLRVAPAEGRPAWLSQEKFAALQAGHFEVKTVAGGSPPSGVPGGWVQAVVPEGSVEGWAATDQFRLGYNPFDSRYFNYLWGVVTRLDLGTSYMYKEPVGSRLLQRLPATAELAVAGVFVELVLGLPVGIISALRQHTVLDRVTMLLALLGVSAPSFWLGLILLYLFGFVWPVFPLGGRAGLDSLVLPAVTLGLAGAAWYARMLRASMLEILQADYVRTARAKGLPGWMVLFRHSLRNAIQPILSMVGMDLAYYMGGVVLVEAVFSWKGIGYEMWQAISNQDLPVIVGMITFASVAIVAMNFVVDLLYVVVDPRVRLA